MGHRKRGQGAVRGKANVESSPGGPDVVRPHGVLTVERNLVLSSTSAFRDFACDDKRQNNTQTFAFKRTHAQPKHTLSYSCCG